MGEYKVLNQHLPGGTEERHGKPWSRQCHLNSKRAPSSIVRNIGAWSSLIPCAVQNMNAIQQAHDRMTTPQILNFWCVSGAVLWTFWLILIFLHHFSCYNPRTSSVLRSLLTLVSAPVVPSDKTAWSKGSNRLGASYLKTETERASETWCFSI